MLLKGSRCYSLLMVVLGCALIYSCGKKQQEAEAPLKPVTNPQVSDLELQLQKQEVVCHDQRECPSYLTKIAVIENEKLRFCTGFLTEQNMVATSATCLPERLQIEGLSCEKDVHFFFFNNNRKPRRVSCKQIHRASKIEGKYAYFWRNNLAYLELGESLAGIPTPPIARQLGMENGEKLVSWTIDQLEDGFQGIMKSQDCESIHNSYINPLANHRASPVGLLAGCNFADSNTGSPVVDTDGNVRGVMSVKPNEEAMNAVLSLGMQNKFLPFVHVTNFACAPVLSGEDVLDRSECFKKLDIDQFLLLRKDMISDAILRPYLEKIEKKIPQNDYLKYGMKLVSEMELLEVKVEPICFHNTQRWIHRAPNPTGFELILPNHALKKNMDRAGKVSVLEIERSKNSVWYQFSPKDLRKEGKVTVFAWFNWNTNSTHYPGIPRSCSNLLL